jgi:REP element-mobilizing transposase RayT
MKRIVSRTLPDGSVRNVQPFHVCLEGLEKAVLCRDDRDYDAFVKIICVAARRKNVIVVIYTVVSNHSHATILACCQDDADAYGEEVKKMASMWVSGRYGERKLLRRTDVKVPCLDNDWYVRNTLAYVPRNALDNGCNVNEYRWSGYRAMFLGKDAPEDPGPVRKVGEMTRREHRALFHTGDDLSGVPWLVDADGCLIPESFCDTDYLEQAFNYDQVYFIRTIGEVNVAEMRQRLVDGPRTLRNDDEVLKDAAAEADRWFKTGLADLSRLQKTRLIPYFYRTRKTTIRQLARVFGMGREEIQSILHSK